MVKLVKITSVLIWISLALTSCQTTTNKLTEGELSMRAYKLEASNDFRGSIACYNKLIKMDSVKGEYYYGRGYAYRVMGFHSNEAISDYEKAASLNYRVGDCYFSIGLSYSFLNDSLALIYFKKAIEISPMDTVLKEKYDNCLGRLKAKTSYLKLGPD